jgi:hypothetical protein
VTAELNPEWCFSRRPWEDLVAEHSKLQGRNTFFTHFFKSKGKTWLASLLSSWYKNNEYPQPPSPPTCTPRNVFSSMLVYLLTVGHLGQGPEMYSFLHLSLLYKM